MEQLVVFDNINPEDRVMLCTGIVIVAALVYSLSIDKIRPGKFMRICYPSFKSAMIINLVLLSITWIVIWLLKLSGVLLTVLTIAVYVYIVGIILAVIKVGRSNSFIAMILCKLINMRYALPTPEAIRSCVFMIIVSVTPSYMLFTMLRLINNMKNSYEDTTDPAATDNSEHQQPVDAASISYIIFMFYLLVLVILVVSINLFGGLFPNIWWVLTGSKDENIPKYFTMFLCISLVMCALLTMSPPKESLVTNAGTDISDVLEAVLRSSCINNVVVSLVAGIAFCRST